MQTKLLTVLCLLVSACCWAQLPNTTTAPLKRSQSSILNNQQILAEDCSNGKDDNGNGLVDCEDYSCYFQKPVNTCNCIPSNTLWTANAIGELYWANTITGVETRIGAMGQVMTDLAWTPDGKFYGLDFNANIYEIDPATATVQQRFSIPGNAAANAMTSDLDGNLYIAGGTRVFKYSRTSGQVVEVADLSLLGVFSGGDLAFSNGALYLSCNSNQIAKIDVLTKKIEVKTIIGLPSGANIFGIVSSADGSLYISGSAEIFKLNPADMRAEPFYQYKSTGVAIWGLANYNDNCNAPEPDCKAEVTLIAETSEPYCSDAGVKLNATGKGVTGTGRYLWQTPDGLIQASTSILAKKTGWYKVTFSSQDAFCNDADSLYINIVQKPAVNLGNDTLMCVGTQFLIKNKSGHASFQNVWHDRSTGVQFNVVRDGKYWLTVSNACGTASDTILIHSKKVPTVDLGANRELCPYDTVHLQNFLHESDQQYHWSNNAATPQIVVEQPGQLWVDVTNVCGTTRGEITVTEKSTGCECYLYVPNAFTPNNDGKNDLFKISATCGVTGELTVFNRWGTAVYQTKDLSRGWNGLVKGKLQTTDTYIYTISYKFLNRPTVHTQKGTVHLIR